VFAAWVNELVKETTCAGNARVGRITRVIRKKSRAALVYGQMTSRPVRAFGWASRGYRGGIISGRKRGGVLLFSLTTFSASYRRVQKFPRCWPACLRRWDTNPTSTPEIGECRSALHSTRKDPITSVQAIYVPADDTPIPRPPPPSHIWTHKPNRRQIGGTGILPGGGPCQLLRRILMCGIVGEK